MENNLTTGSVGKNLLFFSLPYLLSYFLQTLYGMADLYIIGQFDGVEAITAVSIGSQVMHMITVMLVGLAMGATVTIAQAVGRKDKENAAENIGNTVLLFVTVSIVLTVFLLLTRSICTVMSTPNEAVEGTVRYLTICFIGIPFITAYNVISSIFRGLGDSKSPMYFIAAACAVNIALDYLFMGAMQMGPAGAALGTTLSQACSVILSLLVILRRKLGVSVEKKHFRPIKQRMTHILRIGAPIALQDGFIQIAFILITIIANRRGLNDAAAVGIVEKIMSFMFLVPSSMLSAVSALGAQNIGAGQITRAKQTLRYAVFITVSFGAVVSVLMQFFAEPMIALFTDAGTAAGAAVVVLGGQYLRGYIWDSIFAGVHFSFSGYFCACGRSEISFLHNVCAIVLLRIPGAYLASKWFPDTLFPMGLATAAASLLSVAICVIAYGMLSRKESRIMQQP